MLRQGRFIPLHKPEDTYALYLRELDGQRVCVVCNFDKEQKIDLPANGKILLSNYGRLDGDESEFRPYEAAVFSL